MKSIDWPLVRHTKGMAPLFLAALMSLALIAGPGAYSTPARAAEAGRGMLYRSLANDPLWHVYQTHFVGPEGNVIDNVNGGISHTESQGYGMVLALAADDKASFERIYRFARTRLGVRQDNLFAWKYDPRSNPAVADTNNASDGDLLIAWALLEAHAAGWTPAADGSASTTSYRDDATLILADLEPLLMEHRGIGLLISPASTGFSRPDGGQIINLSYWIFPALERIAALTGERRWLRLVASGEQIIDQFLAQPPHLVPDWAMVTNNRMDAIPAPDRPAHFGYEAVRIPLYLMMADGPRVALGSRLLDAVLDPQSGLVLQKDVQSGGVVGQFVDPGYGAVAALSACRTKGTPMPPVLRTSLDSHYYPATLQLLALIAAKGGKKPCL